MNKYKCLYKYLLFTFIISFLYAIVRYNVFGNVPWEDVPLYITNKAISFTVVLLLMLTIIFKSKFKPIKRKFWEIIFILISLHATVSAILLWKGYFPKFYFDNILNLTGYLSLLFGISAFTSILILNSHRFPIMKKYNLSISSNIRNNIGTLIPFLIVAHLFSMGIKGWLTPINWPGHLIPITLIAFLIMVTYIIKNMKK